MSGARVQRLRRGATERRLELDTGIKSGVRGQVRMTGVAVTGASAFPGAMAGRRSRRFRRTGRGHPVAARRSGKIGRSVSKARQRAEVVDPRGGRAEWKASARRSSRAGFSPPRPRPLPMRQPRRRRQRRRPEAAGAAARSGSGERRTARPTKPASSRLRSPPMGPSPRRPGCGCALVVWSSFSSRSRQ